MNKMLKRFKLASFVALGLGINAAHASSVLSLFENGANAVSDEDRNYLIDRTFGAAPGPGINGLPITGIGAAGQIDVGDSFRGMANFNTLNDSSANLGGSTGNNEWTVVYQFMVIAKVAQGGGAFAFVLGPDPAFEADISGGIAGSPLAGTFTPGSGAMFVFFEGGTAGGGNNFAADFDDSAAGALGVVSDDGTASTPSPADVSVGPYVSEETFISTAADGTHFWTLGYSSGADLGGPGADGIFGTADDTGPDTSTDPIPGEGFVLTNGAPGLGGLGDSILPAFAFTQGSTGGSFNVSVSRLSNNVGSADSVIINKVIASPFGGLTEFAGSGDIRGVSDLQTAFETSSNTQFSFNAKIPEPASIALLGIGMLGIGMGTRSRRRV